MCIRQRIGGSNPPLTAIFKEELVRKYGLFFRLWHRLRGDENARPGFDNAHQRVGQTGRLRTGCPKGERSESIPPSPPYLKKSSYASTGSFFACGTACRGMRTPDRGSTTRISGLDRLDACVGPTDEPSNVSVASQSPNVPDSTEPKIPLRRYTYRSYRSRTGLCRPDKRSAIRHRVLLCDMLSLGRGPG